MTLPSWILLIEDDPDTLELLKDFLELEGYVVEKAEHGRLALERLSAAQAPPCLILLDLMMPVMNGWEFIEEQRKTQGFAGIPVAVLSAYGRAEQAARELGAAACLKKPIDIEPLLATVRRHCPAQT